MIHQLGRNRAGTRVVIFVTGARVIPYRIVNRVVGCDRSAKASIRFPDRLAFSRRYLIFLPC